MNAAWVLAGLALLRLGELLYARHTGRGLVARGAVLAPNDGYTLLVVVHVAWFIACAIEAQAPWSRLGFWTWLGGGLFAAGLMLRYWSMSALGARWNTRVYVLPDAPLVRTGPYRFVKHPIYVGVALELLGIPLAFGLWWTAVAFVPIHAVAVLTRIRKEERALGIRPDPSA